MAAKSLSATMTGIVTSRISQSFICGLNTSTMQKAGIHIKRPKTANPKGWSTTGLENNYKAPSSVRLAEMKNKIESQPLALNKFSKLDLYNRIANKSAETVSSSSAYHMPARCHSLDRNHIECDSRQHALNIARDRDDDYADDKDRVLPNVDGKSTGKIPLANESVAEAVIENVKEVTKDKEKLNATEKKNTKNVLSNTITGQYSRTFTHALNSKDLKNKPGYNDSGLVANVQRSLDINLNGAESGKLDTKKNLSMDINVLVSVKSPDNKINNEIGFKDITKQNEVLSEEGANQSTQMQKLLTNNSDVMSQEDLTQEIGKVHDFLKNNGKIQITNSKDRCQNYTKIKNLYFNALGCVKAFKELRICATDSRLANNGNQPSQESDLKTSTSSKGISHNKSGLLSTGVPSLMKVRTYASDSATESTTKKSDCDKAKKLPCLQASELSGSAPKIATKSVCEKLCMPCCKPARDPPLCFFPYHKPPCKKEKPPRPAYSECKQLFEMKPMTPCECIRPRATSCKPSQKSQTCAKK